MADDWRNYLKNSDLEYWREKFKSSNFPNASYYFPQSWLDHLNNWKYYLDNNYPPNDFSGEWQDFFYYWHSHLMDWSKTLKNWSDNLTKREQDLQQNKRNLENDQRKFNQQQTELNRREQNFQQNQLNQNQFTSWYNNLNKRESDLNQREFELKLRERKLERMESAGKNNSAKSNFYASSSDDEDHYPSNVHGYNDIQQKQKPISIDKTPASTRNTRQSPSVRPAPAQKNSTPVTDEFNEMMNMTGYDLNRARQNFISKYNITALTCKNVSERMRVPVPSPIFGESNEISDGEYWAVKSQGNKFAVFPNVKNYSDNHHDERAMGEVFSSNFTPGKVYKKIYVESPALFELQNNSWRLISKGRLRLR